MGATADKKLLDLRKDIWKYLLLKQIKITTGYFPGLLNTRVNWQAVRSQQGILVVEIIPNSIATYLPENGDANDRSVCFQTIQSNRKIFSYPYLLAADEMQQEWNQKILLTFPPFLLIQGFFSKITKEKVNTAILEILAQQNQP